MAVLDSALGKSTSYPQNYAPELLFPISRKENRAKYGIASENLPFKGWDVWNCYEVSFLTYNNLPVSGILKIRYSSDSDCIIESKSLKLYLNSFNLEKMGETAESAAQAFESTVKQDLTRSLRTPVYVNLFVKDIQSIKPFGDFSFPVLTDMVAKEELNKIVIDDFTENPDLLESKDGKNLKSVYFQSDLLRSNCPVTNQPDWGDLFCIIETDKEIDLRGIIRYLVSFRKENHFHEEVAEMIFQRFLTKFQPKRLLIAAMYTRRGGIDINPIRATHDAMIDAAFLSTERLLAKTSRQ